MKRTGLNAKQKVKAESPLETEQRLINRKIDETNESQGHKEVRLEHKRSKLAQESLDRRAARLNEMIIQQKHRLAVESQENRSARLQNMRILQKEHLDNETGDDRAARLERLSVLRDERLAKETQEEKTARLKHQSTLQEEKIANETVHKRAARLKHQNNLQEKKLAKETSDERAVRLKRQCAYKENALANETPEQNSARLQNMSVYKRQFAQDAVLKVVNAEHLRNNETAPLIHQTILKDKVVKEKMDKFHHEMSSIESTICIVCSQKNFLALKWHHSQLHVYDVLSRQSKPKTLFL